MTLTDWRDASPGDVAPLYAAEHARWRDTLAWDAAEGWDVVERGRLAGHVAGWLLRGRRGAVEGWTFYILHDGWLQIGGLTASRPAVARRLLDAVLASPEASLAHGLSCFVLPDKSGLESALKRQRFDVRHSLYLSRAIEPGDGEARAAGEEARRIRPWRAHDLPGAVHLVQAAYRGVPGAACFAPAGRREQWIQYMGQLIQTPACGRFDPHASFVAGAESSIDAMVLTTRIAPDVLHLAQVAVAPGTRRRGLGAALVEHVIGAGVRSGARAVTLMVDRENTAAQALYRRLGFTESARFLYASRGARRRLAA